MKKTYQAVEIRVIPVAEDAIRTSVMNNRIEEWDEVFDSSDI